MLAIDSAPTTDGTANECDVRIDAGGPWPRAALRTADQRWVQLHSARDPIGEANRLIAAAFSQGEPDGLVCVGLGLGYVLDAVERRSQSTKVVALEPLPATLPALRSRRDWSDWLGTDRLVILEGPHYCGLDKALAGIAGHNRPEPVVVVHPVLARERQRVFGEAEWRVERALMRLGAGGRWADNLAPARNPQEGARPNNVADSATTTESLLASLALPLSVVGNSSVHYPFGKRIDSYASVIRFNNFRIRGFEDRVGRRTTCRCTTGWSDIEHRPEFVEFTPFTSDARESTHLDQYNRGNDRPVISARTNVKRLLTATPNPSTGLALVRLLQALKIPADIFAFDGFRSGHYWKQDPLWTTHSTSELDDLLAIGDIVVCGDVLDYSALYAAEEARPTPLADPEVLAGLAPQLYGKRVLEIRSGGAEITRQLERQGNAVTIVELADVNGSGDAGAMVGLPWMVALDQRFDCVVVGDALRHLVPNDLSIVLREARRLAPALLASVFDPSDPRPASWWTAQLGRHFDVTTDTTGSTLIFRGTTPDA